MINVTFYNFSKRKNSTALPGSGTTSAVVPVLLKDRCSQEAPVLEIESSDPDNYNSYNYVYIPFFSRYYFVRKKEVDTGERLFFYLDLDYLGSFKSAIQLSSGFIKYTAQGVYTIPDSRMCRTMGYTQSVATAELPQIVGAKSYWICMIGSNKTTTYCISKQNLLTLFTLAQLSQHQISAGNDVMEILKNLGDLFIELYNEVLVKGCALNYLKSAYVLPFQPDEEVLGAATDVYAGQLNTKIQASPLVEAVFSQAVAISIPWTVTDWRRCEPYTSVYLYLPLFGIIPLDTNTLVDSSYLTIKYSISYTDGTLTYSVETQSNRIIATGSTNVRSEYGVGSSNVGMSPNAYLATFLSGVAAEYYNSPNLSNNSMGSDLNSIVGLLDSFGKGYSTGGGLGGLSSTGLETRFKCWVITKNLADDQANFATMFGLPYFKVDSFAGKTGFLQTQDFVFSYSGATQEEKDRISEFLDNGIYIE